MSKPLLSIALMLLAAGCSKQSVEVNGPLSSPAFVGSDQCVVCHQEEYGLWKGSHHELAMQIANDETVLGDFSDFVFEYFDSKTSLSRKDGEFLVTTENSLGEQQTFRVTHTFGVEPLQQYLVDFRDGRKQSLPFTWDSRSADEGGQRWYHLYPDEYVGPDDPLHWTGRYFTWNTACAECHSTNVELGYDVGSDSFSTTFAEVSVGCEACHGPGSLHIQQAASEKFDEFFGLPADLDDRKASSWIMNFETGIAERSEANHRNQQPESCGRCHSRRSRITDDYRYGKPLTDTHMVSLLEESLYHADGRMLDEVYVYGSFLQSKMYSAGVSCTDCHNPHSGKLHAGPDPNNTCAQCHLTAKFANVEHSNADVGNCVGCHMPATTYMGVDDRRDHSFRLPNTAVDPDHYGAAIAAGRAGSANKRLLAAIANESYPAIARATMLTLLEPDPSKEAASLITAQCRDSDPLVRIAALRALRNQGFSSGIQSGSSLLQDPVRAVRIEAALTFARFRDLLPAADSRAFRSAADEYREALRANASDPGAAVNLAEFESQMGNHSIAAEFYKHALMIGPDFAPAHYAYGLSQIRAGKTENVLDHLQLASRLAPEVARYAYVYGVALNSMGNSDEAVRILRDAHRAFENDFDIGWALATIHRDRGEREAAFAVAEELSKKFPGRYEVTSLIESLQRQ